MRKHQVIIAAYIFSIFHQVDIYLHRLALFEDGASLPVRSSTTLCMSKASLRLNNVQPLWFILFSFRTAESSGNTRGGQWLCYTGERFLQSWHRCSSGHQPHPTDIRASIYNPEKPLFPSFLPWPISQECHSSGPFCRAHSVAVSHPIPHSH